LVAGFADSTSVTMFSRSNFDPLMFVPLAPGKGSAGIIGAPWAVAAPFGPPLALRAVISEIRLWPSSSPKSGLPGVSQRLDAHP
jgi:hypothetical protein